MSRIMLNFHPFSNTTHISGNRAKEATYYLSFSSFHFAWEACVPGWKGLGICCGNSSYKEVIHLSGELSLLSWTRLVRQGFFGLVLCFCQVDHAGVHGLSSPRKFTVSIQPWLVHWGQGASAAGGGVGKKDRWLRVSPVPIHSDIVPREHLVPARYYSNLWGERAPPLEWKGLGREAVKRSQAGQRDGKTGTVTATSPLSEAEMNFCSKIWKLEFNMQ